jgi:hypothetical protein
MMKSLTFSLQGLAASLLLAFGTVVSGSAAAAPIFQVNPNSNGLTAGGSVFTADAISGFSSARVLHTGVGTNYTADGYIVFNGFSLNSSPVSTGASRVNLDYGLYAVFHQDFACTGILAPGVSCTPSNLSLSLWADFGNDNTYNHAMLGVNPSINIVGSQLKLASSNFVFSGEGGIDAFGGIYQNINMSWNLTDEGKAYFVDPDPFFTASFAAFNNTSQGVVCNVADCNGATDVAITQEGGILDFNGTAVPEPGMLGLLGIGLLGMAGTSRRKQR